MTQIAEACLNNEPSELTLGSVVALNGEHGVVWHVTHDTLRVLPITRGATSVQLSLANEVALHLPVTLGGWSVAYDELVAWPRSFCSLAGELNDRTLLRVLDARKSAKAVTRPALAAEVMAAANRSISRSVHN
jgi:hypothetical protein